MPKDTFRLRTLVRLRESERDALRGRLAEGMRAADKLAEQHADLGAEADALAAERRDRTAVARPDVARLLDAQRYESSLRGRMKLIEDDQAKVAEEVERRRAALVAAETAVRTLERLRERHELREREEQRRREVALFDEIASRRPAAPLQENESL